MIISEKNRWWLVLNDSFRDKDGRAIGVISKMMTFGVDHSQIYCNTGNSLKDGDLQHSSALAQSPEGDIEPNHPSEINPTADREVMVAPGGMCNTGYRLVSRTETKIASQPSYNIELYEIALLTNSMEMFWCFNKCESQSDRTVLSSSFSDDIQSENNENVLKIAHRIH